MRERHAARRARSGEPHDVLRADVGREDRRADEEPAEVSTREEIVVGGVLVAPRDPPGEDEEKTEVQQNDQPVPAGHEGSLEQVGGPHYTSRGPCQGTPLVAIFQHMIDPLSRRDWLKAVGAAGAGALTPPVHPGFAPGVSTDPGRKSGAPPILPLTSTSDVFVPPRGRAFQKFSFDFPEPSVEFAGLKFGFLVFSRENAYGLDAGRMTAAETTEGLEVRASGLVWAGGQERASGQGIATLRTQGDAVLGDIAAEMNQPIKAVTTVLRGVPRGKLSSGGGDPFDPRDNEVLWGYPFGGGDLFGENTAGGMGTPLTVVQASEREFVALSSLDDRVRTKRFYFQPRERGYRVELVHEGEGWLGQSRVQGPTWRGARGATLEAAVAPHYAHLERAYRWPRWETRGDVPVWLRRTALVVTLHGMHFTGYVFNDYARMHSILDWIAAQIPAERVLVFISAWDGRYYWDYPTY